MVLEGQLVKIRVLGRKPVLNGDVGQDLRRRRGGRDKERLRVGGRDLGFGTTELPGRRADSRRTTFDARQVPTVVAQRAIRIGRRESGRLSITIK